MLKTQYAIQDNLKETFLVSAVYQLEKKLDEDLYWHLRHVIPQKLGRPLHLQLNLNFQKHYDHD